MNTMEKIESTIAKSAKEIVMEYMRSVDQREFKSARSLLIDRVSYSGPQGLGSFDSAEPYLKYLEHLSLPKSEIKKVFADGNDVCLIHESNFATPPVTLFVCTWYRVDDGKISSIRVVFDPRPFVRQTK
jgi:tRNA G37 N-methylase TrmD